MISTGGYHFHLAVITGNCPWCDGYFHVGSSSAEGTIFAWHTRSPLDRSYAPVHDLQILYLFKLFGIISNERHAKRVSVRPYQHIH